MPTWPEQLIGAVIPDKFDLQMNCAGGTVERLRTKGHVVDGSYQVVGKGNAKHANLTVSEEISYLITTAEPGAGEPSVLVCPKSLLTNPARLFAEDSRLHWAPTESNADGFSDQTIRRKNASVFRFVQGDPDNDVLGLRAPQIGALHAVLGHWSVSHEPVTVVMPTGTGKTETMLALLAHGTIQRLLVVVPSNPLRGQTYRKFLTWGLLPNLGVLADGFEFPIVGRLDHELQSAEEAEKLFSPCNVIVATVQALIGSGAEAQAKVVELTSHLFLDEAHHVAAPSWRTIKHQFVGKPIVQFTATPYRRDSKRVEGRIIYSYPLRKAQSEGYFSSIQYRPVFEFDRATADRKIVETGILQLRSDIEAGYDHLLMARVDTIKRAEEVVELYKELGADFNPIFIHSQLGIAKQREALAAIRGRASKIIVCVDMLGEGFDLPQLKIAAIHDVHKSLAITLQFTGRFTRSAGDHLGPATMVANAGDVSMEHALRQLYAEDADWNRIIREIGDQAIGTRVKQSEFLATFPEAAGVPLENVLPKMSTVVYRTTCDDWTPSALSDALSPDIVYVGPLWSQAHKVALFVTREFEEVPWGDVRELQNLTWHLYLFFWDEESKLLYINSSNNDELHQGVAMAISDETAERIHGEDVYRALHNVTRLVLMNLGLLNKLGRAIRHTMHNGSDVGEQLKPGQLAGKSKTNLFGRGYESGERVSIGCSLKGRVWSYQVAESIPDWVDWCKVIGAKLTDDTITDEQVLRGVLRPEPVTERPALVPLDVDWNVRTYLRSETALHIRIGEAMDPFYETELRILNHATTGDIKFAVVTSDGSAEYKAVFTAEGVFFEAVGAEAFAVTGRGATNPLSTLFQKEPPVILFEQDTSIEDNLLFVVHGDMIGPIDREQIDVWDWTGVDLAKESQRIEKRADSIQRRVISKLLDDGALEFIFDDDSSGESADVVAVRREGIFLHVDLYHCKFAKDGTVGLRVEDLYQVCGQTQKSIRWRDKPERLFEHLRLREMKRLKVAKPSRIEKGDARLLYELLNSSHLLTPVYRMFIVQPGLSKKDATTAQLRLLGATELYLSETFSIPLRVIASA